MTRNELETLCSKFALVGNFQFGIPHGSGHINDTYLIQTDCGNQYVLQRVNHEVFKKPIDVMHNINLVTFFLREKIRAEGGDPCREAMTLVPAMDGKMYVQTNAEDVFRMYLLIENAVCYDLIDTPKTFFNAAQSFGRFQRMLADFPAEELRETIPHFHDTFHYYNKLEDAIERDCLGRSKDVVQEIQFIRERVADTHIINQAFASNELPLRVTHNDTKLNNVMFDKNTNNALCVIDLDTVMPGSLLFDFGDAIRYGANTAAEDETDLSKVSLDLNLFKEFTKGYLSELSSSITPIELELLPFSAKLLTLECGIRFLTDYLVGDIYFKIHKLNHNLDRARTQLKLVEDIESKLPQMKQIVADASTTLK